MRDGFSSPNDAKVTKELTGLAAQRTSVENTIKSLGQQIGQGTAAITSETIASFGALLSQKLRSPEEKEFPRQYVSLLVGRVEIGSTTVRITGNKIH